MRSVQERPPVGPLAAPAESFGIGHLAGEMNAGRIVITGEYRRRRLGRRWSRTQQIGLIFSLLANLPIPVIILNERATTRWTATNGRLHQFRAVLDGAGRLLTVQKWLAGQLAVPAGWFSAEDRIGGQAGRVLYTDLTAAAARRCRVQLQLQVVTYSYPSLEAEQDVYRLVNGHGVPRDRRG